MISEILRKVIINNYCLFEGIPTYYCNEGFSLEAEISNLRKLIKEEIIDKFKEKEQRFLHNRKEVLLENQKELDLAIENYSKLEKFVKLLDLTLGG